MEQPELPGDAVSVQHVPALHPPPLYHLHHAIVMYISWYHVSCYYGGSVTAHLDGHRQVGVDVDCAVHVALASLACNITINFAQSSSQCDLG